MRRLFSFLLIFLFVALYAEEIGIPARGMGATYREAVNEALISALEQHSGVVLSSSERTAISESELSVTSSNGDKTSIESRDALNLNVQKASQGRINRYEILSDNFDANTKKYTVEIMAYLPGEYSLVNSIPTNRRRMAVGTFYRKAENVSVYGVSIQTLTWTEMFANALTVHLTQSRKFDMLDRRFEGAVAEELKRLSSANANPADAVRLCKQLGTDYLLVGSILFCDVVAPGTNPYTGEALASAPSPFVDINYRVILAPTGELKWSDNVRVNTSEFSYANIAEFVANSADLCAKHVADGILNALLPLELVDIAPDGHVVIGEGGVSLTEGDVLTVYAQGKEVFDTRSGESLGKTEVKIGLVLVDRVTEKMSYGKVIEGDLSKFEIGKTRLDRRTVYVVEPEAPTPVSPAPSQVRGTGTGGVVVPF